MFVTSARRRRCQSGPCPLIDPQSMVLWAAWNFHASLLRTDRDSSSRFRRTTSRPEADRASLSPRTCMTSSDLQRYNNRESPRSQATRRITGSPGPQCRRKLLAETALQWHLQTPRRCSRTNRLGSKHQPTSSEDGEDGRLSNFFAPRRFHSRLPRTYRSWYASH